MSLMYCANCMLLCENECPECGSTNLREPLENDPVYLRTDDIVWSGVVEEILDDNKIPYIKKGTLGAGLATTIGLTLESYSIYVPYGAYEKAKELTDTLDEAIESEAETESDDTDTE